MFLLFQDQYFYYFLKLLYDSRFIMLHFLWKKLDKLIRGLLKTLNVMLKQVQHDVESF